MSISAMEMRIDNPLYILLQLYMVMLFTKYLINFSIPGREKCTVRRFPRELWIAKSVEIVEFHSGFPREFALNFYKISTFLNSLFFLVFALFLCEDELWRILSPMDVYKSIHRNRFYYFQVKWIGVSMDRAPQAFGGTLGSSNKHILNIKNMTSFSLSDPP